MQKAFGLADRYLRRSQWKMQSRLAQVPAIEVMAEENHNNYRDIWPEKQFVYRLKGPAYIEPWFGWVITEDGVLIDDSLAPQILYKPHWRNGLPLVASFLEAKRSPDRLEEADEVVSIRHWWEYNYYHFHLDVLGKLNLLRQAGVPDSTPLALGRYARQLGWVKQILEQGELANRRYLIPDLENRTFIRANSVIYCRTQQGYRERMDYVLDLMGVPLPPKGASGRRVFLTRRKPATRTLVNIDAVEAFLQGHGFEIVDTNKMTVPEQIRLFNETGVLVALHGAGLTNIVYRRGGPLAVLELHSQNYVSADMRNISAEYGYRHFRIAGIPAGGNPQHADYHIDLGELEATVRQMLDVTG